MWTPRRARGEGQHGRPGARGGFGDRGVRLREARHRHGLPSNLQRANLSITDFRCTDRSISNLRRPNRRTTIFADLNLLRLDLYIKIKLGN